MDCASEITYNELTHSLTITTTKKSINEIFFLKSDLFK